MNRKTVRKQQQRPIFDVIDDRLIQGFLHHIRRQEHHDGGSFHRVIGFRDVKAIRLGQWPTRAALAKPDDDVKAGVLEVQRVGAALAAVAEYCNLLIAETGNIDITF